MARKELGERKRQGAKRLLNWAIIFQLKMAKVKKIRQALEAKTHAKLSGSFSAPRALELLDEEVCTDYPIYHVYGCLHVDWLPLC